MDSIHFYTITHFFRVSKKTCKLTNHSADKLEVAKMVRVAVGGGVDHVRDSVSG